MSGCVRSAARWQWPWTAKAEALCNTATLAGKRLEDDIDIRERLKADILATRKAGDAERVAVLRTLLGAIGNAEAIELDTSHPREVQGWGEVPRRRLTTDDLAGIIRREAAELRSAAADFEMRGQPAEAERLRARARLVEEYLRHLG